MPGKEKPALGESLKEPLGKNSTVVARRLLKMEESASQARDGWRQSSNCEFEKVLQASEPMQLLEEHISEPDLKRQKVVEKLVRRVASEGEEDLEFGDDLNEEHENGLIVHSRQLIANEQSL